MIGKVSFVAAAIWLGALAAALADPAGRYNIVGSNPGNGSRYSGTATVERTGDTYRVTWSIAGTTYVGTGIGSDKGFAVTYSAGNQTGLAIYGAKGDGWEGVWTYTGGRTIGSEVWTRR